MRPEPVVSIIINNYNYGSFLKEAIDSTLNQSYPKTEVIVVDDGSTDNSRQIIANYGQRIIPVLKDNGGQASALNAGFAHSRGDVVIFLDADDILLPHTAKRVAEIFQINPDIARVQYRLEILNERGSRTNTVIPPLYLPLPNGNLGRNFLELINCASWSPTSGNAFAAWSLRQILPMPEHTFRLCADYYLSRVNALCGPIVSLEEIGAYYRAHSANGYFTTTINLNRIRQQVLFTRDAHIHIKLFAESLGLNGYPADVVTMPDEIFLAQRMISCKLTPKQHPIQEDTLFSLCWLGLKAAFRRPNLSLALKFIHIFWFVGMLWAAQPFALLLAEQFSPETRHPVNDVLKFLQGRQKYAPIDKDGNDSNLHIKLAAIKH